VFFGEFISALLDKPAVAPKYSKIDFFNRLLGEKNRMPATDTALQLLDRELLQIRSKLIDLAASLDRIQRVTGSLPGDPRIEKIKKAAQIIAGQSPNRAEQILMLFSLPYDEHV
jgi:hypothetical protein